ncbi:hypothetical protein Pmani_017830 [Petrolisthes manimaculis]|uniref:Uncharacterized protein n=1 Tax=Petrolisthes manimaculis TaxID=1843537 RepID=A0AAE1U7C4_9EUCA|nr:hypothetical protein Pmani_017830 [Petrolisthes manimaculis]
MSFPLPSLPPLLPPSAATPTGAETTAVAAPAVVVVAASDLTSAATSGHGGGGGGGGKQGGEKFFMYAHQPSQKEYEFGFKRGNYDHTIERYEKAGPKHNFKTKVRWEDSKGGHGEHYWDYNHTPKYNDDHGDDHHDHHGGDDHYHDDHHHDHSGYHSQPVPDYAPAASANTATATAPHTQPQPSTTYRHRKQPRNNNNKDEIKKAEEQDRKKNYKYYNEKQTFEYQMSTSDPNLQQHEAQQESPSTFPHLQQESPSTFPHMLGYNPYLPPEITKEPFFTQDAASAFSTGSSTLSPKRVTPHTIASIPRPPPQVSAATVSEPLYSRFDPRYTATTTSTGTTSTSPFGRRHVRVGPSATKRTLKNGQDVKTKAVTTTTTTSPSPPLNPSGLSFDAETGRVYNEGTGVWYSLVPMKQA